MKRLKAFAVGMILAAAGLMFYCGSFYITSYRQNKEAEENWKQIEQTAHTSEQTSEDHAVKQKKRKEKNKKQKIRESFGISWENLRKINSQTVAWITIPGADISYPVVQAADDEYYLKHNFRGEEDLFGCIFLEHDIKKNFTDSHSILYGHNIEGNMMFANLNRYEQPEFLKKCPEIEITTPKRKFLYKIFSVEQASSQSPAFEYGYKLSSPAYRRQLSILKNNSMYDTGVEPDERERMVTLITCNSRLDKEIRMAVHGICHECYGIEKAEPK